MDQLGDRIQRVEQEVRLQLRSQHQSRFCQPRFELDARNSRSREVW